VSEVQTRQGEKGLIAFGETEAGAIFADWGEVTRRGIDRRGGRRGVCGRGLPAEVGWVERGRVFCGRVHGSKGEKEGGDVQRPFISRWRSVVGGEGGTRKLFIG
jgi:hypothetical protein